MAVYYVDWLARKHATLIDFIKAEARGTTDWHRAAGHAAAAFDLMGIQGPDPDTLAAAARVAFPPQVSIKKSTPEPVVAADENFVNPPKRKRRTRKKAVKKTAGAVLPLD